MHCIHSPLKQWNTQGAKMFTKRKRQITKNYDTEPKEQKKTENKQTESETELLWSAWKTPNLKR